jgi:hypothetical protein
MRSLLACALVTALVSCKSQKNEAPAEQPAAAEPASATAEPVVPPPAGEPPPPAAPATKPAEPETRPAAKSAGRPLVTLAELKKKGLKPYVDAARGVSVVTAGTAKQLCGAAVAKQVAAWKKLLAEAQSLAADGEFADVMDCDDLGDRTACWYHHPASDDAYTFVFAAGSTGQPVLAGLVTDSNDDAQAKLVKLEPCPAR